MSGPFPYGVRWAEYRRNGERIVKQKDFPTEKAREKVSQRDSFAEFLAWSDPIPDQDDPGSVPEEDPR